jgi:Domain of unknown function (DUF4224)
MQSKLLTDDDLLEITGKKRRSKQVECFKEASASCASRAADLSSRGRSTKRCSRKRPALRVWLRRTGMWSGVSPSDFGDSAVEVR